MAPKLSCYIFKWKDGHLWFQGVINRNCLANTSQPFLKSYPGVARFGTMQYIQQLKPKPALSASGEPTLQLEMLGEGKNSVCEVKIS